MSLGQRRGNDVRAGFGRPHKPEIEAILGPQKQQRASLLYHPARGSLEQREIKRSRNRLEQREPATNTTRMLINTAMVFHLAFLMFAKVFTKRAAALES
jgi:hypothetical protein